MNGSLKNVLLKIPAIKQRYDRVSELLSTVTSLQEENIKLRNILDSSRSPGLTQSPEDMLTERLMAHPVQRHLPSIELTSIPPKEMDQRVEVADRLIASYHKALADEERSPIKRDGEDLWTGLLRKELPDLMESIDTKDPVALATFLVNFGKSYVWFGGITTCIDGYNRNLARDQIALTYWDKLVSLAESLGVLRMENPENGPWGDNLLLDPSEVVQLIEQELGIEIAAPTGIIHTDGIQAGDGCFHYRHINSLYSAIRVARLSNPGSSVCEVGGGLGLTAMYAQRLGIGRYTVLDLPITCLLAGHYLLHAVGQDQVTLYGETPRKSGSIELFPYWEIVNMKANSYDLVLNQDSLPEIADNLIKEFLSNIKRIGIESFLSINHECFYPRTVKNFTDESKDFKEVYRSKSWVREGYLEELYRINS